LERVLALAAGQHGVVTRAQLRELGLSGNGIDHRVRRGRLHRVGQGVYAVGRPQRTPAQQARDRLRDRTTPRPA
jgi:predicted transcriptional regulator of viral defense system